MDPKPVTTTIMLDRDTWLLLRRLSGLRAARLGGRPSQSGTVAELIRAAAVEPAAKADARN